MQNLNPLASLCSWAGRFESILVANPEDRFSRVAAKIIVMVRYLFDLLPSGNESLFISSGSFRTPDGLLWRIDLNPRASEHSEGEIKCTPRNTRSTLGSVSQMDNSIITDE